MDVNSGKFTVPVSGVYMFLLNVYGAPRDPVVLSIKSDKNVAFKVQTNKYLQAE